MSLLIVPHFLQSIEAQIRHVLQSFLSNAQDPAGKNISLCSYYNDVYAADWHKNFFELHFLPHVVLFSLVSESSQIQALCALFPFSGH